MNERIDLIVVGGYERDFHMWCRNQEIAPNYVMRVNRLERLYGYNDCEYTIIGSFSFYDEFIIYAQSHNITRMEDHVQRLQPKIEPRIDWPKELAKADKFRELYMPEFKQYDPDDDIPF